MQRWSQRQNEQSAIDHIKLISRALFQERSASPFEGSERKKQFSPYHHFRQGGQINEGSYMAQSHLAYESPKKLTMYSPARERFTQTEHLNINKQKEIPYFTSLQQFQQSQQSRPARKVKPFSETINRTVYGKFKTDSRVVAKAVPQNYRPSKAESEQMWKQFLSREQQWSKEKKKRKREAELKSLSTHSPQINRRSRNMISNEDPVFNQEMSEVEMNIEALRQQTEQIRLKIMRVATETPSRLRKTFDSPPP